MKTVVLVGPQNVGKTTLFNRLTNSHHKVVNYPGSTVDYYIGFLAQKSDCPARIIDTPGILNLTPKTLDEDVTLRALKQLDTLIGNKQAHPDLLVAVVDCTQLARQLPLVRQLLRTKIPMLLALSKSDLKGKAFSAINPPILETELGCPVILYSGKETVGTDLLTLKIESLLKTLPAHCSPNFEELSPNVVDDYIWAKSLTSRSIQFIHHNQHDLDKLFLHRWIGPLIFVSIMFSFFWSIFALATPLMDGIDLGIEAVSQYVITTIPSGILQEFLVQGFISGIGSVLVFIPQIFLLFLLLGILEGSGYLARGAVLIDRPLSAIGLSGRSFVPLLSGCACAIPAMMAARTIPNKKERLTTLFIIPLMTCSARLPVYGLLISLLLGHSHAALAGFAMTSIYIGSFVFASITAVIVGKSLNLKQYPTSFQMELPRWHWPLFTVILSNSMKQTFSFLQKAGLPIAIISWSLWLLGRFPSPENSIIIMISHWIAPLLHPIGVDGKMGVAILLSFAAREVFASSVSLLYPTGLTLTLASNISLIIFFMISMQCLPTVAVAKKEMGGWKLPLIMLGSYVGVAYILSCLAHSLISLI